MRLWLTELQGHGAPDFKVHPGALGDYACSVGDNSNGEYNTERANGAFVLADYQYLRPPVNGDRYIMIRWNSRTTFRSIEDGLSNTIFIGEKHYRRGYLPSCHPLPGQAGQDSGTDLLEP